MNTEDFLKFYANAYSHFPDIRKLTKQVNDLNQLLKDLEAAPIPEAESAQTDNTIPVNEKWDYAAAVVTLSPSERKMTGNYKCALTHKKCTCWEAGFWYGDDCNECGYKSSSFGAHYDDTCRFYGLKRSEKVQKRIADFEAGKKITVQEPATIFKISFDEEKYNALGREWGLEK